MGLTCSDLSNKSDLGLGSPTWYSAGVDKGVEGKKDFKYYSLQLRRVRETDVARARHIKQPCCFRFNMVFCQ